MKHVLVLGGGKIGSAIGHDLSKDYSVSVADINKKTLEELNRKYNFQTIYSDFSNINNLHP